MPRSDRTLAVVAAIAASCGGGPPCSAEVSGPVSGTLVCDQLDVRSQIWGNTFLTISMPTSGVAPSLNAGISFAQFPLKAGHYRMSDSQGTGTLFWPRTTTPQQWWFAAAGSSCPCGDFGLDLTSVSALIPYPASPNPTQWRYDVHGTFRATMVATGAPGDPVDVVVSF
ncbi:MAG TPA: hypothetical protein VLW85_24940 [Myxococcales bacterium]|nr:hypothetical protein [Myxococcales bacterium]